MGDNNTTSTSSTDARQQIVDFVVVGLMILCLLWIPCVFLKCRSQRNSDMNRQESAQLQAELERVRESLLAMFREEVARTVRAASSQRIQERKAYITSKLLTKTVRFPSPSMETDEISDNGKYGSSRCEVPDIAGEDQLESSELQNGSCAICLNEYKDGEEVSWSPNTNCSHQFHQVCITEWLLTHEECPCCRHAFLASTSTDEEDASSAVNGPSGASYEQTLGRGLELFNRLTQLSNASVHSHTGLAQPSVDSTHSVAGSTVVDERN